MAKPRRLNPATLAQCAICQKVGTISKYLAMLCRTHENMVCCDSVVCREWAESEMAPADFNRNEEEDLWVVFTLEQGG